MKLALLSFSKSTRLRARALATNENMILRAAKKLGHDIKVIRAEKCQIFGGRKSMKVLYNGKPFPKFDAIIPRVTLLSDIDIETSIIKQLELCGHLMVNKFQPIVNAKNKLRTMQIMIDNKLPVPKTIIVRRFEFLDDAIAQVGGVPVVLKMPHGSLGVGVAIVESKRSLHSALDIFWKSRDHQYMMIQEYIKESEGKDVRVFVVGGKIVAAMERSAQEGEFRSNMSIGGSGAPTELSDEEQRIALKATKAMGLQVAGVDLLRSNQGPLIMEVNANPGVSGITETTNIDVCSEIIKYTEKLVNMNKALSKAKKI